MLYKDEHQLHNNYAIALTFLNLVCYHSVNYCWKFGRDPFIIQWDMKFELDFF